jgi:hypothetical protein
MSARQVQELRYRPAERAHKADPGEWRAVAHIGRSASTPTFVPVLLTLLNLCTFPALELTLNSNPYHVGAFLSRPQHSINACKRPCRETCWHLFIVDSLATHRLNDCR